jgi:hypothetical protein
VDERIVEELRRDYVPTLLVRVRSIIAVSITKLFAWERGIVEDMCYERRRAEA